MGDSNPRYGNPYVSLANWWFQPLTQPSKSLEKFLAEPLLSNAMQRYNIFLKPPNFFINFFHILDKTIIFCEKHHSFRQMPHFSPTLSVFNRHAAIKYSIRTTYKIRKKRATHHHELSSKYKSGILFLLPLWLCSHSRGRTEKQHEDSDGTCLYQHFQLSQKFKLKGADTTKEGSPLLDGSNEP